jgi:hypothetical protein
VKPAKKPVKRKDGERMEAPPSGVKVRMYRQGLGDCFLLAFPDGEKPFYVLIDCGVIVGTPDASSKMKDVATDLVKATGGRIDVLVATHQHWDHLSGFEQAKDVFAPIQFGEVWVAWTEDPADLLAARLRAKRETALRGLHAAAQGLRASDGTSRLDPILGFFGELGADGRPSGLHNALEFVLSRGNTRYHTPGRPPLPLPGGARAYVLGPPRDEKLLLRSDPSRRASEVYEKKLGLDEETAFFAAAMATVPGTGMTLTEEEEELRAMSVPFDKPCGLSFDQAQKNGFFQAHYFGAPSPPRSRGKEKEKEKKDISWRRIDDAWLGAAEKLALQLDGDTNNTSLALAIELSPGGKVLLFPGDAQVGNWLSWESLSWPREGKPDDPVTAADLLRRTVLYKVGHHASHNATLRAKGLELMESPDLVAMIPVDEKMARDVKGWDMPFGELFKRLQEKTSGRILRADTGLPEKPPQVTAEDWQQFLNNCSPPTSLYVEITIPS